MALCLFHQPCGVRHRSSISSLSTTRERGTFLTLNVQRDVSNKDLSIGNVVWIKNQEIYQQKTGTGRQDRNREGLCISLTAFWLRIYFWNFTLDRYLPAHSRFHLLYQKAWILSLNIAIFSWGTKSKHLCFELGLYFMGLQKWAAISSKLAFCFCDVWSFLTKKLSISTFLLNKVICVQYEDLSTNPKGTATDFI